MPRVWVRKTSRGEIDLTSYSTAYEEVKAGDSLRQAANKHGINHCSLLRYILKRDASGKDDEGMGYKAHNRVFSEDQERELSKYLIRCADIYFGLSKKEVRKLAYELTIKYNLSRPRTYKRKIQPRTDRPNPENTIESALVSIFNVNPTEDETPPLSPSLLTEELQLTLQTIVEQQGESPVPTIQQVNDHEPEETVKTPPRLGNIGIYQEISPRPSTSAQASNDRIHFTPEAVRPLPKAPPRKNNKGRKTRKSTIYTDTPEKEEIRKEHKEKLKRTKAKQIKKRLNERKVFFFLLKSFLYGKISKGKKKKPQQELSSDEFEEEEYYCIVCLAPFSESRSGEKWIQCTSCKHWAHEECTEGGLTYVCHNCDSKYSD